MSYLKDIWHIYMTLSASKYASIIVSRSVRQGHTAAAVLEIRTRYFDHVIFIPSKASTQTYSSIGHF